VAGPSGGGVGFAEVEVIASWRGGYLIMRASSASWAAELAWHECIRLCSGDASRVRWVVSRITNDMLLGAIAASTGLWVIGITVTVSYLVITA
jgi:hypothetical protein